MPANQTFSVTLSLKDADTVKRGLEQLGTSGQNALKRLESATTPASRALVLLNQASGAVQGGMSELASRSGAAGEALSSLGKGGLAAAAALGAVAVAIAAAVNAANAATEHFGDIADAAERAGTSAENFQTLQRVAEANASSAEELGTAMETLKVKISEAAEGNAEAQRAFESAGISMQRLGDIGGDTALVLNEMSKNGASAAEMADLLGRGAKGLSPTMQALNGDLEATKQNLLELGLIASNDTVASFDELADRGVSRLNEEFAKWAPALLAVAQGMETLREEAYRLLDALKPAIEWTDWFWQKYSQIARTLAANPMGPFVGPMAKSSEPVQALADQAKFPQLRMPTPTQISIATPVAKGGGRRAGGGGGGKSEAVRDAERDADAIADLRKEIELFGRTRDAAIDKATSQLSNHASADQIAEVKDLAGQLYDLGEAQKAASEAEREHQQLLSEGKSLYEAMRTPAEEYAATLARLNELQSADVITPTTYNRALDAAKEKLDAITQKTAEANAESGKWFDQLQLNTNLISTTSSTLSGMFTDAFMGERKLADVLAEIPGLITKIIMQKMIELAITTAIQAASGGAASAGAGIGGAIAGLFSSGGGAYGTTGSGGTTTSGGTNPGFLLGGAAKGAVFHGGNVIPFARGGIVDRPTLFPMAKGAGLMGEAGPEAIMPLRRTASGDLGVRAQTPPMQVIVNNYGDSQVQQREERGADGSTRLILDLVKREVAADMTRPGTQLNKAVSAANNPVRVR